MLHIVLEDLFSLASAMDKSCLDWSHYHWCENVLSEFPVSKFPEQNRWTNLESLCCVKCILKNRIKKDFYYCHVLLCVYLYCCVSCRWLYTEGSLNDTGLGECGHFQRQISRVSLERDLTEKNHKTSFKGQTEIACLPSITSSSNPPHLNPIPLEGL